MNKLRTALILDNLGMRKWQKNALEQACDILDIQLILNCKNTKTKKRFIKNFSYYMLNVLALKNDMTKRSVYKISNETVLDFDSIYTGNWQSLPKNILEHLIDKKIDVVIKFGMSLLKIDERLDEIPILSFHHGDPSKFRGRPAGFYELLNNEEKSGLIVQKLTNKLDGGEILAFAESKLVHHSYKKSAEQFYRQSQFLLRKALINLDKGVSVPIPTDGKNYHLPSNFVVMQFFVLLLSRRFKHLAYGAVFEKKWKVGTVEFKPNLRNDNSIDLSDINEFVIDPDYSFYADPFFSLDTSKVRLEALNSKSGLGDILEIDLDNLNSSKLLLTGAHYSYPFSFLLNDEEQLLPEVATHSPQYFFSLDNDENERITLKGLEDKRLADATLFKHSDLWYLFFGGDNLAHSVLNLWVSNSLTENFKQHPCSPICMSPSSARMAGRILLTEEGLFRFGQNNNRSYGASIAISEITKLNAEEYKEEVCGSIKINDCLGPHSIDFNKDKGIALIDYYTDSFSLFAGVRRLKALISKS